MKLHATELRLRAGGQTGVDRAALDFALSQGIGYAGWCPRGGWAEDLQEPPGLLAKYLHLREAPSTDPRQRTAWNVRDSDATLILTPDGRLDRSPGSDFTLVCADLLFTRPVRVVDMSSPLAAKEVVTWLLEISSGREADGIELNIGGPRESETPGVYTTASAFLRSVWSALSPGRSVTEGPAIV